MAATGGVVLTDVLRLHRAQVAGIVEKRGVGRMKKLYQGARVDLADRLKALQLAGKGDTFTAHHMRMVLLQVDDGLRTFGQTLKGHLRQTGRLAQAVGSHHAISAVKKLEKRFTGLTPVLQVEQAGVLMGIYKKVTPALIERYKVSQVLYARPVRVKIRESLAQAIIENETVDAAVERVVGIGGVFDGESWRAERIVRTEMAYSYGVTQQRTMAEMVRVDLPDLQKKLIATFDSRTGEDSEELHGQVQNVGDPFVWTKTTKKGTEVIEYMMPPNRPNDREVVIPWRPGWEDSAQTEAGGKGPGDVKPSVPSESLTEGVPE